MHLYYAKTIAETLVRDLQPYCDIINIAGSIRRKKPEVKDMELVCIPKKAVHKETNLFGDVVKEITIIHPEFERIIRQAGTIVKGKFIGRQMQVEMKRDFEGQQHTIMLDMFMPQPNDYWRQFAIRTGSADYTKQYIANKWKARGWCGTTDGLRLIKECNQDAHGKWTLKTNIHNPTLPPVWQSEEDFFKWLFVQYLPPDQRNL